MFYDIIKYKSIYFENQDLILCLILQGIFIKDSNSLAYYNMNNGSVIHLALKERGGRKK